MGGLSAYRIDNYNNTAEREQFRFLCERLKDHYEKSEEFCMIVGNYNIGVELDALLIKRDAIIVIELKNYRGHIIAAENGDWTCDGSPIKGGSRKTVLQQARINHSTVKRELKALGIDKKQIKDVPTLIIFHQPIELDNRLSATNKSWLHITDDAHAIEKIEDITCPHTDLSLSDMERLSELLYISDFYLPEFSNAVRTTDTTNAEVQAVTEEKTAPTLRAESSSISLPAWLDEYIFGKLGAKYSPDHIRYEYNLNLDKKETLTYLGTYFPRSYAEAIVLFEELCSKTKYLEHMKTYQSLNVLDLGCGTGGEILGLLSFMEKHLIELQTVNILAIDGNHESLRLYEEVMNAYKTHSRFNINNKVGPAFIENEDDLELIASIIGDKFDVILSFKAICELVAKKRINGNAYEHCTGILAPHLAEQGIMLLEDVTILSDVVGMFLPYYMNKGINDCLRNESPTYKTILPSSCRNHENTCMSGCFYNKKITVSHSRKTCDVSKIIYRFVGRLPFVNEISPADYEDIECK